jgi:putative membrane protein
MSLKKGLLTVINGALIGVANIIPGVSGGTFALILGVFDRLINALDAISFNTVKVLSGLFTGGFSPLARENFIKELKRIDALFLILLVGAAGLSALSLSFAIKFFLGTYPGPTLAFFIGLILPSVMVPWAMMDKKGVRLLLILPGMALTVGVSLAMPDNAAGNDNPLWAAACGAIAISAMILPGISGSFILLVLGQYQNFILKATGFIAALLKGGIDFGAFIWLAAFGIGIIFGILLFAKFLAYLLKKAKSATMAFLIGLLLGSLFVLWPFKDLSKGAKIQDRHGEVKQEIQIATAKNRMPDSSPEAAVAFGAFAAGLAGSYGLILLGRKKEEEEEETAP